MGENDMQKTYSENELPELSAEKCSVIYALEIIGGKWKLPVIWKLSKQETIRYNALKRSLNGITNIMLTRTLQDLEKNGLVQRVAYDMIPPHVEYSLTEDAKTLIPALQIIGSWGKNKMLREGHL
ncbi:MAG: helix-turn-helix transcriptional regulator [Lachnospiraceae bacterium]|nr:helix-turn-helix transcriptional regulator [Lachnospiraceae bacterium]